MKPIIINGKITNYFIDEQGNIYNSKTNRYLQGSIKSGYRTVKLTIDNIKKDYLIHRLVIQTFMPNKNYKELQVNHIDGNKENNSLENLEWVTPSENVQHSWKNNERQKRRKQNKIKDIDEIMNNDLEWKQYLDTNYYISKEGVCVNIKTNKILNPSKTASGYLRYYLYINKKKIGILAHTLVYTTFNFAEQINLNEQINHKDGNKENNSINNLEKITNSENMLHSYYVLKQNTTKVSQYLINGEYINSYQSLSEAERKTGFLASGISQVLNGKLKTYKGFVWKKE